MTGVDLIEHGPDAAAEGCQLAEGLLQDGGEREKAKGVPRWGRIEYDDRIFHGLDMPGEENIKRGRREQNKRCVCARTS